jgi:osmotically-inducible protein OsmY
VTSLARTASIVILCGVLAGACGTGSRSRHDDMTISTKVKIELIADPALGALRLDVSTLGGVVTLTGTVASQAEADRAVAAAKRVPGVRAVRAAMTVGTRQ